VASWRKSVLVEVLWGEGEVGCVVQRLASYEQEVLIMGWESAAWPQSMGDVIVEYLTRKSISQDRDKMQTLAITAGWDFGAAFGGGCSAAWVL
jgi:hypothetical protein